MKVLFLTHRLPYAPNRGDRIRAYYLMRELSRFASVSLCSLVHDADEAAQVGHVPFAAHVAGVRTSRAADVRRAAAGVFSGRPLTHLLLDAPGLRGTLASLVASSRPDLVLAYCSGMARFALEPPLAGFPFVLDMVDVDSAKWTELASRASPPRRWIYRREGSVLRRFEAEAAQRARATFVVNDRERKMLREIAPAARIEVLENGVDLDAFRRTGSRPETSQDVVFCGVLDYEPNESAVLWFVDAVWPAVRAAQPRARFRIVGARPTARLERAAARDTSIDLVGAVPKVQPFLWEAAVAVAPLQLARGVQNKVLEALAAGLPVVATPVVLDGLPAQARPGCVAAADAAAFARSIVDLLSAGPSARANLAAQARMDGLGWAERLSSLQNALEDALRDGGQRTRSSDDAAAVAAR